MGRLSGGVLTEIEDPPAYRTDYTADEIERLRAIYREKKRAADAAKSALYPFDEHDW